MFLRTILKFALIALCLVMAGPAIAGQSITIQGRVVDSSGNPVNGASVVFRVKILSPLASRCVLYDESQTLNLSGNSGLFSINLGNGSGTVNAPATYTLEQALSNRTGFSVDATYCASGTGTITYSPLADDNRKVVISFRDPGSMSVFESIPEMDLNPMAFAIESRAVGGYPASSLLKVENAGVPGSAASLTSANFTELQALLAGNSSYYMSSDGASTSGAKLPSYAGNPSSSAAGSIWFDNSSGGGVIKYKDSSGTVRTIGVSGGSTITSVTANDGLTASTTSGAVTVGMETLSPSPSGTHGSATKVPVFTVDIYGRVTSVTDTTITGTLPTGSSGQFLRSNGTAWSGQNIGLADLRSTISGPLFDAPTCTSAQTLYWNSGADAFRCQSIAALDAAAITTGTVPAARLPASASYWEAATGGINFAGGNVGVGTTAPAYPLQIENSASNADQIKLTNPTAGTIAYSGIRMDTDGTSTSGGSVRAYSSAFTPSGSGVPNSFQVRSFTGMANGLVLASGGAAAPVSFYTADTEKMRLTSAGNVGIGTTAPVATGGTTLELYNAANTGDPMSNATLRLTSVNRNANVQLKGASSGGYQFVDSSSTVVGQVNYDFATNKLAFQTNGTNPRMTIDGTGNVGIGTTGPAYPFHVVTNWGASTTPMLAAENTNSGGKASIQALNNAGGYVNLSMNGNAYPLPQYSNAAGFTTGNTSKFALVLDEQTTTGGSAPFQITTGGYANDPTFTITAGNPGRVGIATTSPSSTLEVNGTASVGASLESITAYTNTGAAYSIPDATKNIRRLTLNANTTITLPAFTTPADKVWTLTVMVKQDGVGSRTLAFAAASGDSILWDQSATAPAPQSAASKISIYQFTKASDETTWYGSQVWKQN